MIIQSLLKGFF